MQLNTKTRYGLRAIIEIAKEGDIGIFQKEIAERQNLPIKYLDAIMAGLRAAGLIRNVKGKRSGYILAKPANEISIYDIYRAFEPELAIVECLNDPILCNLEIGCRVREFWGELNSTIKSKMIEKKLNMFI
jgi:Rrf2 family protein